jgi:hypothetical protein
MGENVTFVSERQLAEGTAPKVPYILVPAATHVQEKTVQALARFAASGGKVICIGEGCLGYDEYHRARQLPRALAKADLVAWVDDEKIEARLIRTELLRHGWRPRDLLVAGSAERAWGVEYRVVTQPGRTLVSAVNLLKEPQTVEIPWLAGPATDLLSGQKADLKKLTLAPMVPVLLVAPAGR